MKKKRETFASATKMGANLKAISQSKVLAGRAHGEDKHRKEIKKTSQLALVLPELR